MAYLAEVAVVNRNRREDRLYFILLLLLERKNLLDSVAAVGVSRHPFDVCRVAVR